MTTKGEIFWSDGQIVCFLVSTSFKPLKPKSLSLFNNSPSLQLLIIFNLVVTGSGCSTAVEHTPAERNFGGRGFDSCQVLGFFSLFLSLSGISLIKSLKEVLT